MSSDWPDSFPQTDLPEGLVEQRYNPYRRQLEQIHLASRFLDGAPAYPPVVLAALDPSQIIVRCCHISPMARQWCQNPTEFLIHMDREGREQWVPACSEHLGALVRGVGEGNAIEESQSE